MRIVAEVPADRDALVLDQSRLVGQVQDRATVRAQLAVPGGCAACLAEAVGLFVLRRACHDSPVSGTVMVPGVPMRPSRNLADRIEDH